MFAFWEDEFVVVFVDEEYFAFPGLIDFAGYDFSDSVFVFAVECVVFEFEDF